MNYDHMPAVELHAAVSAERVALIRAATEHLGKWAGLVLVRYADVQAASVWDSRNPFAPVLDVFVTPTEFEQLRPLALLVEDDNAEPITTCRQAPPQRWGADPWEMRWGC